MVRTPSNAESRLKIPHDANSPSHPSLSRRRFAQSTLPVGGLGLSLDDIALVQRRSTNGNKTEARWRFSRMTATSNPTSKDISAGPPIVRTSVAHGTAYDIAGRGVADCGSLLAAGSVFRRCGGVTVLI